MLCEDPFMVGSIPCPCGDCRPCRINRRRIWTNRMLLEGYLHEKKCFLTLTYDDDHLPKDASLNPRHSQLFIKRLRKELPVGSLRYLLVGEYGGYYYGSDSTRRVNPHYHIALYGLDCAGKITFYESGTRCWCDVCERIRTVWGKGNIVVEGLTRKSAQYIAGYVVKKLNFDSKVHEGRYPEFMRCSRRPGIAGGVVDRFLDSMRAPDGSYFLNERGDVPNVFMIEGKTLPMGRFLISKLRDAAGIKEVNKNAYAAQMQALWYDAQLDPSISEEEKISYKAVILNHFAGSRANSNAAFNLFKQKGVL